MGNAASRSDEGDNDDYDQDDNEDDDCSDCNESNKGNSNNDCYWRGRGYDERPQDVGDAHAAYCNANNPNNNSYGRYAEHPNDYVKRVYGKCCGLTSRAPRAPTTSVARVLAGRA